MLEYGCLRWEEKKCAGNEPLGDYDAAVHCAEMNEIFIVVIQIFKNESYYVPKLPMNYSFIFYGSFRNKIVLSRLLLIWSLVSLYDQLPEADVMMRW